jgi:hypothetical protein
MTTIQELSQKISYCIETYGDRQVSPIEMAGLDSRIHEISIPQLTAKRESLVSSPITGRALSPLLAELESLKKEKEDTISDQTLVRMAIKNQKKFLTLIKLRDLFIQWLKNAETLKPVFTEDVSSLVKKRLFILILDEMTIQGFFSSPYAHTLFDFKELQEILTEKMTKEDAQFILKSVITSEHLIFLSQIPVFCEAFLLSPLLNTHLPHLYDEAGELALTQYMQVMLQYEDSIKQFSRCPCKWDFAVQKALFMILKENSIMWATLPRLYPEVDKQNLALDNAQSYGNIRMLLPFFPQEVLSRPTANLATNRIYQILGDRWEPHHAWNFSLSNNYRVVQGLPKDAKKALASQLVETKEDLTILQEWILICVQENDHETLEEIYPLLTKNLQNEMLEQLIIFFEEKLKNFKRDLLFDRLLLSLPLMRLISTKLRENKQNVLRYLFVYVPEGQQILKAAFKDEAVMDRFFRCYIHEGIFIVPLEQIEDEFLRHLTPEKAIPYRNIMYYQKDEDLKNILRDNDKRTIMAAIRAKCSLFLSRFFLLLHHSSASSSLKFLDWMLYNMPLAELADIRRKVSFDICLLQHWNNSSFAKNYFSSDNFIRHLNQCDVEFRQKFLHNDDFQRFVHQRLKERKIASKDEFFKRFIR